MSEDVEERFQGEFVMAQRRGPIQIVLSQIQAWAILSYVQIACRHSQAGAMSLRMFAEQGARRIQALVAPDGAMAEVADLGWGTEPVRPPEDSAIASAEVLITGLRAETYVRALTGRPAREVAQLLHQILGERGAQAVAVELIRRSGPATSVGGIDRGLN